MLKAVLRYTDCLQDGRNVFGILAENKIKILKTTSFLDHPRITICVDDYDQLNKLLFKLNANCQYEVRVVKVKKPFFEM